VKSEHSIIVHSPSLKEGIVTCTYTVANEKFTNSYTLPDAYDLALANQPLTRKLCEWVAIISSFGLFSVEYFDEVICEFALTDNDVRFFEKLIYLGFGEFRFVNDIAMDKKTHVRSSIENAPVLLSSESTPTYDRGPLLLNGGGKDGSVSAWLLSQTGQSFTWFQRGDSVAQSNVTAVWNAPVISIKRNLDPNRSNRQYAGHRPMSAGIAFVALLTAHLYGYSDVIASNEASANEGNATFGDFTLNHQYSKSLEFERDIQSLLKDVGIRINYFSLLRPLHELQIAKIATKLGNNQLGAITSCNNGTRTGTWCMSCAKCAFIALVMTAADPAAARKIWGNDTDTINTPSLHNYLVELLDPNVDKPLECVGTLDECQLAARMIVENHSGILTQETNDILAKYASLSAQDSGQFMTSFSEASIPQQYMSVVAQMKDVLVTH